MVTVRTVNPRENVALSTAVCGANEASRGNEPSLAPQTDSLEQTEFERLR